MKSATLPPIRVEPAFRERLQGLLAPGETLSTFVEQAVVMSVERRESDAAFAARAMASREAARASGRYVSAAAVIRRLKAGVAKARKRKLQK